MKYFTKENILLALVSLLVLSKANDLRGSRRGPERARDAIMERMRGMDRSDWGSRMEGMKKARKGKAEGASAQTGSFDFFLEGNAPLSLSPGITCCDEKLPCCDQDLACCDHKN